MTHISMMKLERLLAIEQAAKALFPDFLDGAADEEVGGCACRPCDEHRGTHRKTGMSMWQSPNCLFTKLARALGVKE